MDPATRQRLGQVNALRYVPGQKAGHYGSVASGGHTLSFTLAFSGDSEPVFLLPVDLILTDDRDHGVEIRA